MSTEAVGPMDASISKLLDGLRTAADEPARRAWALTCARALGLGGMAVSLNGELVWFSDATSKRLEDVQFVLGQGPGLLAQDIGTVHQAPDLRRLPAHQWPQYAAEAAQLGVAALFVWPVHIGAIQAGTMTGHRRTPGPLSARQSAQGQLVADALAQHVLSHWPQVSGTREGSGRAATVELHRSQVHQATGILSVRLRVPLPEALDRLRAQAYASHLSLTDTAHAVIHRELLWEPTHDTD
ncbi:ANTAR domain-containing protein [Streptomyces apricus]|uniref:ANTAR domain-containing protein n=1 Tax=Streptomyces apricus TaxID=1828112 RepID=UPI00165FE40B|nr:ANTAR domain-containing protein [Streptomyces apricus]